MPPRGTSSTAQSGPSAPRVTAAPALPEFITNDLYGSLIATAITRGAAVLAAESREHGRTPSVADAIAQQMTERAAVQLRSYHGIDEVEQEQAQEPAQ